MNNALLATVNTNLSMKKNNRLGLLASSVLLGGLLIWAFFTL